MTTIFFVGGEDGEFAEMAGGTVTTTAGRFRSSYARCALAVPSNSTTGPINIENTCRWRPLKDFAASEFWFSARCRQQSTLYTTLNSTLKFLDASGIPRLQFRVSGVGRGVVESVDGAGNVVQLGMTALFAFSSSTIDKLDIHIIYDVAGSIDIYLNGIYIYAFTGDTTTDGVTQLANVDLMTSQVAGQNTYWSEVIIVDVDTRALSLQTFAPVANGNTHDFDTGTPAAANVNEITLDDTTLDGSSVAGQIDQYTNGAVATGTLDVLGLIISARAQKGSSGPANIELGVRTNGSDYWGPDHALDTSWELVQEIFYTNPDIGSPARPWRRNEIGAAVGFNIGAKSVT